jgi:hypothetical protein
MIGLQPYTIYGSSAMHLLSIAAFLQVLMFPRFVQAQHIVALSAYNHTDQYSSTQTISLDATNLGIGRDFYDFPEIQLQLNSDGHLKIFQKVLGSTDRNEPFVGETDTGDLLQLLRYQSPTTGRELLIGSFVDLDTKLVYQMHQQRSASNASLELLGSSERQLTLLQATVQPSSNILKSAEPYQLDATLEAQIEQFHNEADVKYWASSAAADTQDAGDDEEDTNVKIVALMVVWTKQSECQYSFLPKDCILTQETEDNMRAAIAASVAETNSAYSLSDIDIQHELVHAYRHPTYDEDVAHQNDPLGVGPFAVSIINLIFPWDRQLDDVPPTRREYKADMVSLVINDHTYCGIASVGTGYLPYPTAPFMYSVLDWQCLTGSFVLGTPSGKCMCFGALFRLSHSIVFIAALVDSLTVLLSTRAWSQFWLPS